jgi:hypothetical protein
MDINKLIIIALIGVMAFAALRVISQWRGFSFKRPHVDWDAHFIQSLRKTGVDTFAEQTVDFFFTLPTRAAAEQVAGVLRGEGYQIDILEAKEISGQFSLHASRRMRLMVEEMQRLTAYLTGLATAQGGTYDNWAVVTK